MRITFALPADNRSGGVRVTAIMGNLLLDKGHIVRIIYPRRKVTLTRMIKTCVYSKSNSGWLHTFKGKIETFFNINDLHFQPGEIVLAVGTYMVPFVYQIDNKYIIKVRYNHGLPVDLNVRINSDWTYLKCWTVPMRTITVSNSLVPKLKKLTKRPVDMVVPNGIYTSDYFPENRVRNGICAVYSPHPNKAPKDLIKILQTFHKNNSDIKQYVFSENSRPAELTHAFYHRLPSLSKTRELYNRSRMFILPSYNEGLPGTVLEAMACGCVVVSSDNEGSLEIIRDGYNGFICPKGNVERFVKTIEKTYNDEQLLSVIKKNQLETVRSFSWSEAANKMQEFLETIN
ncbi:Glycosyl transferase [Chitinispirillum alkaliphilum]|nr:Glycosyl transferase [Chitinispirillum alkaliphilum]